MLLVGLARLLGGSGTTGTAVGGTEQWIVQRLDHLHFGKGFRQQWRQRYFVNDLWYEEGSQTMILAIGGEGETRGAPGGDESSMDVIGRIAKQYKAKIFQLEHRFYGQSIPTNDSTDQLRYLSVNQAMGDTLHFIDEIDRLHCRDVRIPGKMCNKWILTGGSYSGAFAAWLQQKHQFAFVATLSSSGVVQAAHSLPEFDQQTFYAAGAPCALAYQVAMREIENAMESGDEWPRRFLNIDQALFNLDDFYYFLADAGLMVFQYGNWRQMCPGLNQVYRDNGNVTSHFLSYVKEHYAYDDYSRVQLSNAHSDFRRWWYYTCTEFAYFQPAPGANSIRSARVSLQYHYDVCNFVFGLNLTAETVDSYVQKENNYLGGLSVDGQDVFFSNFWQDVWHDCGITAPTTNAPNVAYVRCRDCGHCCDLHVYKEDDPKAVKDLQDLEVEFISNKLDHYFRQ